MGWNYQRDETRVFSVVPEGPHRIRIKSAEKAVSKTGNDMLTLQFEVSGQKGLIFHHIVFLQDRPEITNRNLTQFYDAFKDIPEGDDNVETWIGKVGACVVKHDEYNGNPKAEVRYFLAVDKQGDLPPWQEPERSDAGGSGSLDVFTEVIGAGKGIPF